MHKKVLVIGGTRYFGKLLVQRLVRAGHHVTIATRGYAPDPFGARIERVRVDRRSEAAMRGAFAGKRYDVVFDQMCYSPLDAAIAVRTFAGKVERYVMTSTIDVYRGIQPPGHALRETDLPVLAQAIDTGYPWHDPKLAVESYVAGKVQAEAYLYRDGSLPLVTARLAHVLGGPDEFTGRLAYYVDLLRCGAALPYANAAAAVSFLGTQEAAAFLDWVGAQDFSGPVNAASGGPLSAHGLFGRVARALDANARFHQVDGATAPGTLSPFDFAEPMVLDTSKALDLGYRFSHSDAWLDDVIRAHDLAFV